MPLIEECTQTLPFNKLLFTIWKISSELQSDELTLTSSEKDKDSRVKTADGTKAHKRTELVEKYQMLCRDVYTVLPLYWAYLQHCRYAITVLIMCVCLYVCVSVSVCMCLCACTHVCVSVCTMFVSVSYNRYTFTYETCM